MIPRIIHQACRDPRALPRELRDNIEQLKRLNPGWNHRLYSHDDMLACLARHLHADDFAQVLRLHPGHAPHAVSQLFRHVVVHREGGVYLEIQSTATRPLDEVLLPSDAYLVSQWRNRLGEEHPGWGNHADLLHVPGGELEMWHIVGEPGHAFSQAAARAAVDNIRHYSAEKTGTGFIGSLRLCGPICYTLAVHPLLDKHSRRIVDIRELGFVHSIYRPHGMLDYMTKAHYGCQTGPVVLPGPETSQGLSREKIFTKVYADRLWGRSKEEGAFFSGPGSHEPEIIGPYLSAVSEFLRAQPRRLNAVDLGCGDFNVGRELRPHCSRYVACDIVRPLMEGNRKKFEHLDVEFTVLDMVGDELPEGDVAFVRQVFQHLSNSAIRAVVDKIAAKYKFLVLTEHLPRSASFIPNLDIRTGQHIRMSIGSGVVLTREPFRLRPESERLLCEVVAGGGVIRTTLYTLR